MKDITKILMATVAIVDALRKVAEALDDKPDNSRGRSRNNGRGGGNRTNKKHYSKSYRKR